MAVIPLKILPVMLIIAGIYGLFDGETDITTAVVMLGAGIGLACFLYGGDSADDKNNGNAAQAEFNNTTQVSSKNTEIPKTQQDNENKQNVCKHCGTECKEGTLYCENCGMAL